MTALLIAASILDVSADSLIGRVGSDLRGDNIFRTSRQVYSGLIPSRSTRFFFAIENDPAEMTGAANARVRIRSRGEKNFHIKIFKRTDGRKNVTAEILTRGIMLSELELDERIKFMTKLRLKRGSRPRSELEFQMIQLRIIGILIGVADPDTKSQDVVTAKLGLR